jgi:hypothetical protein
MDACIPENRAHRLVMMRYNEPIHVSSAADASSADQGRLAAFACLARFTGSSREHTESDLRCFLRWCADRGMDPLAARRVDLEQYIRWMQEACRFKPSTISRRFSVAAGFYRTCVIDGVLVVGRSRIFAQGTNDLRSVARSNPASSDRSYSAICGLLYPVATCG